MISLDALFLLNGIQAKLKSSQCWSAVISICGDEGEGGGGCSRGIVMCFVLHCSVCTACSLGALFFGVSTIFFQFFRQQILSLAFFDKKTDRS